MGAGWRVRAFRVFLISMIYCKYMLGMRMPFEGASHSMEVENE
jgi:hypothetical protein